MASWEPPAPVVPPKGIVGLIEGYDNEAILDLSNMPPNMILLNVYDVSEAEFIQKVNRIATANNNLLVAGVFHAGVEIFGKEWSYGSTEDARSGVGAVLPRMHPQHTYRTTVPMGCIDMNESEVAVLLRRMSGEWCGLHYDLIHNNCISFCNALLQELGLRRVPGWVDRAARAASAVDIASKTVVANTREAVKFVRSASVDLEEAARSLVDQNSEEVQDKITDTVKAVSNQAHETVQDLAVRAQEGATLMSAEIKRLSTDVQEGALPLGEKAAQHASEIGEIAARRASELGEQLFSWGQALSEVAVEKASGTGSNGYANSGGSLDSWTSLTQGFGTSLTDLFGGEAGDAQSKPKRKGSRRSNKEKKLSVEGDADVDPKGTHGLVRASEETFMRTSLLDDQDDDLLPEIVDSPKYIGSGRSSATRAVAPAKEEEAPLEWSSTVTATAAASAPQEEERSFDRLEAPKVDLLA